MSLDDSLSSLSETPFNYINSIVGSGVIGIPYALARAGYGVGLILLIFVAIITDYSLRLMVSARRFHHLTRSNQKFKYFITKPLIVNSDLHSTFIRPAKLPVRHGKCFRQRRLLFDFIPSVLISVSR